MLTSKGRSRLALAGTQCSKLFSFWSTRVMLHDMVRATPTESFASRLVLVTNVAHPLLRLHCLVQTVVHSFRNILTCSKFLFIIDNAPLCLLMMSKDLLSVIGRLISIDVHDLWVPKAKAFFKRSTQRFWTDGIMRCPIIMQGFQFTFLKGKASFRG